MSRLEQDLTIERFESSEIDAERFDHEAHVYVAWLYVTEFDVPSAIARFDSALRRLTAKLGVPGKYHATITWLFLLLIAERIRDDESWQAFKARNPDLIRESQATLQSYYSVARLSSDAARDHFVLPDRIPALGTSG
ncbi:MAG: hypothetical protein ACR2QZ_15965 [Woeseiaceae bacterium]